MASALTGGLGSNTCGPNVQVRRHDKNERDYHDDQLDAQVEEMIRIVRAKAQESGRIGNLIFDDCGGTPETLSPHVKINEIDDGDKQYTAVNRDERELRNRWQKEFGDAQGGAIEK